MHPGQSNSHSTIRFIVPSSGNFILASQFIPNVVGTTDATVYLNGNATTPLFSAATTNGNPMFNTTLALTKNDVLSFAVGPRGSFGFDSTQVDINITVGGNAAAPEPGTLGLLGIALPLLGGVMGRRKGRA